jgi:SSS family solute:Na+ symporter
LGAKVRLPDGTFTGFPLNGVQVSFLASVLAMLGYVLVSLLTCREPHNMDRLLHRGQYAIEPEGGQLPAKPLSRLNPARIIGIDEHFTRRDRWVAGSIFGWNMMWLVLVAIGSVIYFVHPWSDTGWLNFWLVSTGVNVAIGAVVCVWFTFGSTRDMIEFFRRLKQEKVDGGDDGTVGHARGPNGSRAAAGNPPGPPHAEISLSDAAAQ